MSRVFSIFLLTNFKFYGIIKEKGKDETVQMNTDTDYYDGTKLLSMKDINGNDPEIYICSANRTAGKSTWFNRLLVKRFLTTGKKFGLLYRFKYELDDSAEKFFKDIKGLFFPEYEMTNKAHNSRGVYHELYLNDKKCGYAIAMNDADSIKKYSHLLSDIDCLMLDEFQSETNKYCPNEIRKFRSIHTSIARGNGQMTRRVPTYLVGNPVTVLNPYYVAMNISNRLNSKVKFLRGNGFVVEQGFNEAARDAQMNSAFNCAFSNDEEYTAYAAEGVYLNDNEAFIEKPKGVGKYLCTIRYNGKDYGVRQFDAQGVVYCDDKPDLTFKVKIAVTTTDHKINYVMLRANDMYLMSLRYFFQRGCFRFKDLQCKEAILKALSY